MKLTEVEKAQRRKVASALAKAAQYLRYYQRPDLAGQVDEVADGIITGQVIDRPVQ